jgi:hypothetical protein
MLDMLNKDDKKLVFSVWWMRVVQLLSITRFQPNKNSYVKINMGYKDS